MWFFCGLLLCAETLTGTYSYARRLQRHTTRERGQVERVPRTALIVTGGLLLIAAFGGTTEILDYGVAGASDA